MHYSSLDESPFHFPVLCNSHSSNLTHLSNFIYFILISSTFFTFKFQSIYSLYHILVTILTHVFHFPSLLVISPSMLYTLCIFIYNNNFQTISVQTVYFIQLYVTFYEHVKIFMNGSRALFFMSLSNMSIS